MRRREISPEFWTDERVVELTDAAKLLFVGLWNLADREGRLEDRPLAIGFKVRPWAPREAAALLDELLQVGLIVRYVADGVAVLCIPRFADHQRPHPKEVASKLPPPPSSPLPSPPPQPPIPTQDTASREKSRQATEGNGEPGKAGTDRAGSSGPAGPSGSSGPSGSAGPSPAAPVDVEARPGWLHQHLVEPTGDPESWDGMTFWSWLQCRRRERGCLVEKPPHPKKLSTWWSEARGVASVAQLKRAFLEGYAREEHWAAKKLPWNGFVDQWGRHVVLEPAGAGPALACVICGGVAPTGWPDQGVPTCHADAGAVMDWCTERDLVVYEGGAAQWLAARRAAA